jgi:hypothetical protein
MATVVSRAILLIPMDSKLDRNLLPGIGAARHRGVLANGARHSFTNWKSAPFSRNPYGLRALYSMEASRARFTIQPGNPMKRECWLLIAGLLATSSMSWSLAAAAAPQPGGPAEWRPHDIIVDLHNLPVRYTCDDLWYKFHDVLLTLGAGPQMEIVTYRCGPQLGELANSPSVQLRFSLPELLDTGQARWADIDATPRTVRLTPGHPASLRDSDCELLRQLKDELLAALPDRVVSFNLACAAPRPARWPFNVTVQALTPVNTNPRVAAQVSPASLIPKRVF